MIRFYAKSLYQLWLFLVELRMVQLMKKKR
nr:MAG TPA: hypothetical protein [Caudoviricetes sp.]